MKPDNAEKMEGFGEFVNEMLVVWKTPGVAVAVVKDGEVILAEGFGWRNREEHLPVTAETLFAIGSCSKAFTATAMGILVMELVPYQGTEFKLKNLSGFSVEFQLDQSGVVISVDIVQPNGVFTAQKVI